MIYPKLYTRDSNGNIREWWIEQNGNAYTSHSGIVGGATVSTLPQYGIGKNQGKANETTDVEQATKEIEALYKKQRKSNYFDSAADVDGGFLEPQLAKPGAEYLEDFCWSDGVVLDDKLNGFACIIVGGLPFTRKNERYHSIPHIIEAYAEFFKENPNAYVQGELFNLKYVNALNRIAELIAVTRQPKDITPELLAESRRIVEFHWYDGFGFKHPLTGEFIARETPLLKRRQALDQVIVCGLANCIKKVHYDIVYSLKEADRLKHIYIKDKGGEGKVAKNPNAEYQHKRTKDLLKMKKLESKEFKVIRIEEGTGNWAGCAGKVWCELPDGKRAKEFKSNVKGEREHRRKIYQNRDKYPGKWITVEFEELSEYGVPLKPYTDLVCREDIEGRVF